MEKIGSVHIQKPGARTWVISRACAMRSPPHRGNLLHLLHHFCHPFDQLQRSTPA
jgi:hypothetical protein